MEVVTARVLYSKDPAHKKRKRWKDGFFLGKRTKEGKVNLKLLDENGAPLCSRSGLKYENEEDLGDEEGAVCKSFGSGGFQIQFDDFCSSEEIPGTGTHGNNVEDGEKEGAKSQGGAYTELYKRKANPPPPGAALGRENRSPNSNAGVAPSAQRGTVKKYDLMPQVNRVFNRPRFVGSKTESAETPQARPAHQHQSAGPPRPTESPAPSFASADDEILAAFQSGCAKQFRPCAPRDYRRHDDIIFKRDKGASQAPSRSADSKGVWEGAPSVSDWSTKLPKPQKAFNAPWAIEGAPSMNHNNNNRTGGHGPGGGIVQPSGASGSGPFASLAFQTLSDRVVVPTKFSDVGEYRRVWISSIVEEVGMQLSQVKKKLQNWSKRGKGKLPSWIGHCRVVRYDKCQRKFGPEEREPPKFFMNFAKKPYTKSCSMQDLWILGRDLESLCTSSSYGSLVTSLWHGVSSEDRLQIDPVGKMPPLKEPLVAIHGPNVQTEVQMIDLLNKLDARTSPLLQTIMEGPSHPPSVGADDTLALPEDLANLFRLNASQVDFLRAVLLQVTGGSDHGVSILHGPFGSGKTTVIVALIIFLVRHSGIENFSVLISANTNIAVDHVLNGLIAKGFDDLGRIGSVKKIDPKLLKYTVHSKSDSKKEITRELMEMIKVASPADRAFYEEELKFVQNKAKSKNVDKLSAAKVIGVTCHSSTNALMDNRKFDLIILDECSQMIEPLSMLPIIRSKARFLVTVGDPRQLPPVIASPVRSRSGGPTIFRPLFTRLLQLGHTSMLLDTQYRCHPHLGELANRLFYNGKLKHGCTEADRAAMVPGCQPLVLCDCRGTEEWFQGSFINQKEAKLCVDVFVKLMEWGIHPQDIGILCFYREQVKRVGQLLEAAESQAPCLVGTVDSFQGNEKSVIILTTCSPQSSMQMKFCADPTRLNVALTRATHHLIIVGSRGILSTQANWSTIISQAQVLDPNQPFPGPELCEA